MFQNEINQSLAVSDGIKQTLPVTALHPSQITHEALFGIICMGLQYKKKSTQQQNYVVGFMYATSSSSVVKKKFIVKLAPCEWPIN